MYYAYHEEKKFVNIRSSKPHRNAIVFSDSEYNLSHNNLYQVTRDIEDLLILGERPIRLLKDVKIVTKDDLIKNKTKEIIPVLSETMVLYAACLRYLRTYFNTKTFKYGQAIESMHSANTLTDYRFILASRQPVLEKFPFEQHTQILKTASSIAVKTIDDLMLITMVCGEIEYIDMEIIKEKIINN